MWAQLVEAFSGIIQIFYNFTVQLGLPSYGLAIILLTIAIKIILYPLTAKQMASIKGLQEIQPKMEEIKRKYKDKKDKMQEAMMELYKEHNVNPLAGCLPLLVQMPFLIALYQALLKFQYVNPAHAQFFWVQNLSQPDPWILPVLAGAATYWQQKVSTTSTTDPNQRMMLIFMPLFLFWIARSIPAGLGIYWVVFSVVGAIQQIYINKKGKPVTAPAVGAIGEKEGRNKK